MIITQSDTKKAQSYKKRLSDDSLLNCEVIYEPTLFSKTFVIFSKGISSKSLITRSALL